MGMFVAESARKRCAVNLLLLSLTLPTLALAGPADKIYMPSVSAGEFDTAVRGGYQQIDGGRNLYQGVFDVGYGVNDRWASELAVHYDNANADYDPGADEHAAEVTSLEWENILLFTRRGHSWLDVGLYAALVYDTEAKDWVVESGPLLQKRVGQEQFNLNFVFERTLQHNAHTEMLARAQWRHHVKGSLQYGLQSFATLGQLGSLGTADEYTLGPALFGSARVGHGGRLKWNAAVLAGMNRAAPDLSLRFELEFEGD